MPDKLDADERHIFGYNYFAQHGILRMHQATTSFSNAAFVGHIMMIYGPAVYYWLMRRKPAASFSYDDLANTYHFSYHTTRKFPCAKTTVLTAILISGFTCIDHYSLPVDLFTPYRLLSEADYRRQPQK